MTGKPCLRKSVASPEGSGRKGRGRRCVNPGCEVGMLAQAFDPRSIHRSPPPPRRGIALALPTANCGNRNPWAGAVPNPTPSGWAECYRKNLFYRVPPCAKGRCACKAIGPRSCGANLMASIRPLAGRSGSTSRSSQQQGDFPLRVMISTCTSCRGAGLGWGLEFPVARRA